MTDTMAGALIIVGLGWIMAGLCLYYAITKKRRAGQALQGLLALGADRIEVVGRDPARHYEVRVSVHLFKGHDLVAVGHAPTFSQAAEQAIRHWKGKG